MIIDAHCDTALELIEKNENLYKNNLHIDISRMNTPFIQFFATFVNPKTCENPYEKAVQIINNLNDQINIYTNHIQKCLNFSDIQETIKAKKIGAIFSIEGGEVLKGNLQSLETFYNMGIRSICLTWNYSNQIASGIGEDIDNGLTLFGKSVIQKMNELGIIIDVSHISVKSFYDVIELSNKPIIASHSNARKICSHKRNLSDEQILLLKNNGGVMGINLYPSFLSNNKSANLKDIILHIEHIVSIAGTECIGLGSDFDGVDSLPEGIFGVQDLDKIINELLRLNYSESDVKLIAGENFLRILSMLE